MLKSPLKVIESVFRPDGHDFHGFQQTWPLQEGFLTVITKGAIVVSKIEYKAETSCKT